MSIGDTERTTQNRVVDFFKNRDILDYKYLGNLKDKANKNIREDRLRAAQPWSCFQRHARLNLQKA